MTITVGDDLVFTDDYVTKVCAILAQRRKGKTYTASVLAEQLVDAGLPWVALDPTGAWWGVRSSADGTGPGLPVIIFGGRHGDLPLEPEAGRFIADLVLDHPSWYVLDLSAFESKGQERRFATEFAERLFRRKQQGVDFPLHLFLDEADMFVPQEREHREDTRMLGAFQSIVRRGGLHGLGVTLISQRAALVNKSVLTQLDILFLLRMVAGQDQDAVDKSFISRSASKEERLELMGSLASLRIGEAWVSEPGAEPPLLARVLIHQRRTFNSSATPKPGEHLVEPRAFADVDLAAIKDSMAESIERAKADDPVELRKRIRELEHQLAERPAVTETITETVRVPERWVPPELALTLRSFLSDWDDVLSEIGSMGEGLAAMLEQIEQAANAEPPALTPSPPTPAAPVQRPPSAPRAQPVDTDGSMSAYATHLLHALARRHPVPLTDRQWSVAADRSTTSSGWRPAINELLTRGYIVNEHGDWKATDLGLAVAGVDPGTPPPSGAELIDWWCRRIPGPAQTALRTLVDIEHGDGVTLDELADAAGWSRTSSGPGANVNTLVKLGLAERRAGRIHLDDTLR